MARCYSAYGAKAGGGSARSAYTGQYAEVDSGWYALGERLYSPVLRRFLAPDPVSPFEDGGLNRYSYCSGDPVNRIDPSGTTWLAWLGQALRLGSSNAPSGGLSVASPTVMNTMVSSELDTIVLTTAVTSTPPLSAEAQPGSMVFGRATAGAHGAGTVLPAAAKGMDTNDRFVGRQGALPRTKTLKLKWGEVTFDGKPDPERLGRDGTKLRVKPRWIESSPQAAPASRVFATDTVMNADDLPEIFGKLQRQGVTALNLYTGGHGEPFGQNWHIKTGERLDTEGQFFIQDVVKGKKAGEEANISVNVVSMHGMTEQQMVGHLSKDGVHVLAFCYGIADSALMKATGTTKASVFKVGKRYREAWAAISGSATP